MVVIWEANRKSLALNYLEEHEFPEVGVAVFFSYEQYMDNQGSA